MLPAARWSLRLSRPQFRALATRNTPPGPRCAIHRPSPAPRRLVPHRQSSQKPSDDAQRPSDASHQQPPEPSKVDAVAAALANTPNSENSLITPVHIPEDPHGVLKETHPAMRLLDNSAIVVQRQLEMMNVFLGFEQANRYVIMDPQGSHIGYLAEQEHGIGNAMARQMFKTHRSFTTHVFDRDEREVLRFHRPFSWVNSRIRVYDAIGKDANQTSAGVSSLAPSDMRIIGSTEQEWAPLRRKYNLFLARTMDDGPAVPGTPQLSSGDLPLSGSKALTVAEGDGREVGMVQFARVDEPFLSWDFSLMSEDGRLVGSVNRNFAGFARELFTDTGVYALRMDAAGLSAEPSHLVSHTGERAAVSDHPGMTLDQRAVMLATAVSVDFDYFSRHSGSGGLWPIWMPWWGGEAGGAASAGTVAGVGAASETGIAGEAGAAARGLGSAEGWAAGAGMMAGYEAMQRSREASQNSGQEVDSQSPQAPEQSPFPPDQPTQGQQPSEDVWGEGQAPSGQGQDPWGRDGNDDLWGGGGSGGNGGGGSGGAPGGGGSGEGGGGFDFGDWF